MILGLKKGEINLVEPQVGWIEEFHKTQKEIHRAARIAVTRIEHIGSTSIKGIKAKPMIDFVVGVEDIHHVPAFLKSCGILDFTGYVSSLKMRLCSRDLPIKHLMLKPILFI
ncbi:GrpB family protein [Sporosarcina pasteurii]|uniref:Dephospho-CoA kinase/protein folding accessory domain-containing protein n=1 Tax=Sporosarcina pasteurii TaxID=1474 RepID=A0A380CJQ4_SPOPA|nr:GrpB family protein [Sporosarcina pasteurii]MDS9472068.1 GrpB family protein [Sporosarcina pasteurii]SUJ20874.1 dephospho-CoA kinase/protein folding accessory domain-containing protein [Sporosarcina pasteurii]